MRVRVCVCCWTVCLTLCVMVLDGFLSNPNGFSRIIWRRMVVEKCDYMVEMGLLFVGIPVL